MKILWLVNIIMPELAEHLGGKPSVFGGWLSGAMEAVLTENHKLIICTSSGNSKRVGRYEIGENVYYVVDNKDANELEASFRTILCKERPDVIHVFGTEYEQSLAMVRASDKERLLVTIQGSLSVLYPLTYAGIPERICRDNSIHRFLRKKHRGGESIELQRISFEKRAKLEQEALMQAKYVHGGSEWGNAVGRQINPNCTVFDCGLILRDPFYTDIRWDLDACEEHSITAVFTYPIKGFHMILRAMPKILEAFPDAKLHAVGQKLNVRRYHGIKKVLMDLAPDYSWYVQGLMNKYDLWDNVVFDGYLDALQMRERQLKSNVFISSSIMENQCTALGEALMLGVPCIATRAGAMPEFINDGESALLYDFDDVDRLAAHVCKIFSDREYAKKLSLNAPVIPQKLYDRNKNREKLVEMYHTIDQNAKEANQ